MINEINVVIGSWGSYNACNERALGSGWLDFSEYDEWEQIEEKLKARGFKLDGIDEELFVQDIEGLPSDGTDWDYVHPKDLFEMLKESGVLDDPRKYDVMLAYLEVRSFREFEENVKNHGDRWDDDIQLYRGFSWEDYGREMFDCCCYQMEEHLQDFFDFEAYGRYMGEYAEEYSGGIIEIYR